MAFINEILDQFDNQIEAGLNLPRAADLSDTSSENVSKGVFDRVVPTAEDNYGKILKLYSEIFDDLMRGYVISEMIKFESTQKSQINEAQLDNLVVYYDNYHLVPETFDYESEIETYGASRLFSPLTHVVSQIIDRDELMAGNEYALSILSSTATFILADYKINQISKKITESRASGSKKLDIDRDLGVLYSLLEKINPENVFIESIFTDIFTYTTLIKTINPIKDNKLEYLKNFTPIMIKDF